MTIRPETALVRPFVVCAVLRGVRFDPLRYNSFIDLQVGVKWLLFVWLACQALAGLQLHSLVPGSACRGREGWLPLTRGPLVVRPPTAAGQAAPEPVPAAHARGHRHPRPRKDPGKRAAG